MIRVALRTLARFDGEGELQVEGSVTQLSVLAALEARYPVLRETIPRSRHAATPIVLEALRLRAGSVS
jgi:hypothetical protein